MALKLPQEQIDDMARAGILREADGRRVHKMSPISRPDPTGSDTCAADSAAHDVTSPRADDISASLREIAFAINNLTE